MTQIMQQPIAAPGPVPADPSMAVSIRGLYRRYDDKVAVNGLSLDIPTGSFYGLVGPNGAGKTTTINMMTRYISMTVMESRSYSFRKILL